MTEGKGESQKSVKGPGLVGKCIISRVESRRLSTVVMRRSPRISAKRFFLSAGQANRSALIPRRPLALGSVGMTRGVHKCRNSKPGSQTALLADAGQPRAPELKFMEQTPAVWLPAEAV